MKRLAALALVLLAACGGGANDAGSPSSADSPAGQTITGSIRLTDERNIGITDFAIIGHPCSGTHAFADMHSGAQVIVKDGAGAIVGTGSLQEGTLQPLDKDAIALGLVCEMPFSVPVKDADFYVLEVGTRGEQTFSRADLEGMSWVVGLSL